MAKPSPIIAMTAHALKEDIQKVVGPNPAKEDILSFMDANHIQDIQEKYYGKTEFVPLDLMKFCFNWRSINK